MAYWEVNVDSLVGMTHFFGGLSYGNVLSMDHADMVANPKRAALQGLAKMKYMMEAGVKQVVLPPHCRPNMPFLRRCGFQGTDAEVLEAAASHTPDLLRVASSSSFMWTANMGTVCPSADGVSATCQIVPANLHFTYHRALESVFSTQLLRRVFSSESHFTVHDPVDSPFCDEGAANHIRFCEDYGSPGLHLFVFGQYALRHPKMVSNRFPPRQYFEASSTVGRRFGLSDEQVVFARQHPKAIDAGVFHNDVIAMGDRAVFVVHQFAFVDQGTVLEELRNKYHALTGKRLEVVEIPDDDYPLHLAVQTYFFNSQQYKRSDGATMWLLPIQCREDAHTDRLLARLRSEWQCVDDVDYMDLGESMSNGGGPACLRLRLVVSESEWASIHSGVKLTSDLYDQLCRWVSAHYPERMESSMLRDPTLLASSKKALNALAELMGLDGLYDF